MSGFVDEAQLNVRGGDGGAGCVSFRREGPVVYGGPNGGDGGKGGDIWLVADRNVSSLLAFRDYPHRTASSGVHGKGKDQHGRRGESLEVTVPEGTVARDMYTGELMADLANHGDRWLAAAGGRGGRGNAKFLSNRRRAPSFAEQGEHGEDRWLKLELKLMADVALVGFPNVGKSTLISVISAAKPKIADYPFTTLEPNLGVVRLDDVTEFVVADIPGLIEGASEGRGLGHQFLRHIERARVLCVMIDLSAGDGTSPENQLRVLLDELGAYQPDLLERPRVIVGTKADVVEHVAPEVIDEWLSSATVAEAAAGGSAVDAAGGVDTSPMVISSATGRGVRDLVGRMAALVHDARAAQPSYDGIVILRPEADGARVERLGDNEFRLIGRQVERVVALNDVTTPEALNYIDHQMKRLGVPRLLARAGASDGDIIWVGGFSFEYEQEA
jgi:GTPase